MGWIRPSIAGRRLSLIATLAVLFSVAAAMRVSAQGVYASIDNGIVRAMVGESGQDNSQDVTGRIVVQDIRDRTNPVTLLLGPVTDLIGVSQGVPVPGSFVTVRIDGGATGNANQAGWDLIWGAKDTGALTNVGQWLMPPTVVANHILARWSTLPGAGPVFIPPVQVDLDCTLVHDMACFKFTVHNGIVDTVPPTVGSQAHSVGLRFAEHYAIATATTFANQGPVFLSDGRQICTETDLVGSAVPNSWRLFDVQRVESSGANIRPTTTANFNLPDRLVFASANIMSTLWDFIPTSLPGFNFCTQPFDAAAALYWNPRGFQPGEQQDFLTYYGIQRSTIDFTPPWAAGVDAPLSLSFDASKPAGQQLTPSPFQITAFVTNNTPITLTNVTAVLNLPPALALVPNDPNNTATKSVSSVAVNGEAGFSWNVVPTGTASGRTTFSVSFTASPGGQGRSVTRDIDIPALPVQTLPGTLQMVSFPYTFDDPFPATALGLNGLQFDLLRWDPVNLAYRTVSALHPGEGYWLRLPNQTTIRLVGAHDVPKSNFEINLKQGWNQIGNPFLTAVNWGNVLVINTDATDPQFLVPIPVDQAAQAGWIASVIYRYDVNDKAYKFDSDFLTPLVPFVGYWVKALQPNIILVIPPPDTGRAAVARRSPPASTSMGGPGSWTLHLTASSSATTGRGASIIGVGTGAQDGYDRADIEEPPAVQDSVTLAIVRKDWGARAGLFMRDIQAANAGRKQWNVVVSSPKPNTDVTVTWPDIGGVPRSHELYVTDTASGIRHAMRQTSSVTVNTGPTGTRSLVISAEPRGRGAFQITGLAVQPTRGVGATISFTASQDANVTVRVLGSGGQAIRTLTSRAAPAGRNLLTWDYRDARGASVAAGAYIIEVKGSTPDGQSSRLSMPHLVVR